MKVLNIQATEGPNYWSIRRHQLIVMLLDLEEMEERPTNMVPGFLERLKSLMPSLEDHRCSEGIRGGFFLRVADGTWMGHVIEHIALEIQSLAGMETGFGRTRGTGKHGEYHVVFSYQDVESGKFAGEAAVRIAQALIDGSAYDINSDIKTLMAIASRNRFGPSTGSIVEEASKRDIPVIRLDDDSLVQLGYGAAQRRIEATIASTTCSIAVELAGSKTATKKILAANYIPVPEGRQFSEEHHLNDICDEVGFPLVIKPVDGNQGKGATTNIKNYAEALVAFRLAKSFSDNLICEKFISGHDFRALVVNFKFEAAALRTPAQVTGDGVHTIRELIEMANNDPLRGDGHESSLTKIDINECTINFLKSQDLSLDDVVPMKHDVLLRSTANLSTGGTATDVTDSVHPANIKMFERIARIMNLNICGIDIMAENLSEPIIESGASIIEVNAAPGFRMHLNPSFGTPRNVAKPVVDMLFPDNANGRIPIMAITGTNGKTTTTRLLAHITKHAGYQVGYTTTDGIYIDGQMVLQGDCTGPLSAKTVLSDSWVNMAVLECARGGILRGGLGFDKCDIGIVTNVGEDHLGLGGIDTVEKLARVKATVAESVAETGYAVLNADDDLVYAMRENITGNVALFSNNSDNPRIREHVEAGGMAATCENDFITVMKGRMIFRIGRASQIPITFGGAAKFNIANVLAATMAAFIQKIHPRDILEALNTFIPTPESIPGRMNVFEFANHKVIVDYAHNTHGVRSIAEFITSLPATRRIGVIAGVGDRRSEDISELGSQAAMIFDEIIVRHDEDMRGRDKHEVDELLCDGIRKVDPLKKITIIDTEIHAVEEVLNNPVSGCVSVIFADNIKAVISQVQTASRKQSGRALEVA